MQNAAGLLHRILGVGTQIDDDLLQAGGIAEYGDRLFDQPLFDFDVGRQGGAQQLQGFANDRLDRNGDAFERVAHADGLDQVHQLAGLPDGVQDFQNVLPGRRVFGQVNQRHFGVAHHARQHVVEIVGDASGQHADGLHLLGLLHLPFQPGPLVCGFLLFGHIPADGLVFIEPALIVEQGAVDPLLPDFFSVGIGGALFEYGHGGGGCQRLQVLPDCVRRFGREEIEEIVTDHLFLIAGKIGAKNAVDETQGTVRSKPADHGRHVFHDGPIAFLAVLQRVNVPHRSTTGIRIGVVPNEVSLVTHNPVRPQPGFMNAVSSPNRPLTAPDSIEVEKDSCIS